MAEGGPVVCTLRILPRADICFNQPFLDNARGAFHFNLNWTNHSLADVLLGMLAEHYAHYRDRAKLCSRDQHGLITGVVDRGRGGPRIRSRMMQVALKLEF